jgi:hypothetical protein
MLLIVLSSTINALIGNSPPFRFSSPFSFGKEKEHFLFPSLLECLSKAEGELSSETASDAVVQFMLDKRKPFGFPYLGKGSAIKEAVGKR